MQPRHAESQTLIRPPSPSSQATAEPRQKPAEQKRAGQKPVEFTLHAPKASAVVLAGSFNNWDTQKTRLQRVGDAWKTRIPLAPGKYEYRFVVDGQWITDPNCKECVGNDYGSTNSVLVV